MIRDYGSYTDINLSNNKKKSTTNSRRCLYALISIMVLCAVGYYIYPQSAAASFSSNHLFVEELDDKALSDMRIEREKQRPTVWIEYDMGEFVRYAPGATQQDLAFGGSIWRKFHDEQIQKAGYNPSDESYSFAFRVNDGVQSSFTSDYTPPKDPVIIEIDHDDVLYLNSVKDDFDANMDYQRTLVEAAGYDFDDDDLIYVLKIIPDVDSDYVLKVNCGGCGGCRNKGPKPTKPPKTPRPAKTKPPRPTKAPKTPRPAKSPRTPKPAKSPRTPKPKPTAAPTILSSNLDCYTAFKEVSYYSGFQNYAGGYLDEIDCGHPVVKGVTLTSCLSYRPGEGGAAYGEKARQDYYETKYFYCQTWSKAEDVNNPNTVPVAISARCCSSTNNKAVVHSDSIKYLDTGTRVCGTAGDCSDKDQNIIHSGCSAGWSHPGFNVIDGNVGFSKKPMGGKYDGNGGCLVGNSERNYTTASNLCIRAGGPTGNVPWDCQDIESSSATYNSNDGVYESIADCPIGYSILDCNSFIDIITQCTENDSEHSYSLGGYYGANGEQCVAVGNMNNIRAQARCCRIAL